MEYSFRDCKIKNWESQAHNTRVLWMVWQLFSLYMPNILSNMYSILGLLILEKSWGVHTVKTLGTLPKKYTLTGKVFGQILKLTSAWIRVDIKWLQRKGPKSPRESILRYLYYKDDTSESLRAYYKLSGNFNPSSNIPFHMLKSYNPPILFWV